MSNTPHERVAAWFRLWNIAVPDNLEIVPNDRLRRARGRCIPAQNRLELRPDLIDSDETLCHEAAHLAVALTTPDATPHGPEWQRLMTLAGFFPSPSGRGVRGEGRDEERRTQNSERRTLKKSEDDPAASFQRSTFCVLRSAFDGCLFCSPDSRLVFFGNGEVTALWDAYPVSPGHALLIPRRHVATWFDATAAERAALMDATDVAKREIEKTHAPDGYNIGINAGAAAGQTVFHLHVHVIPRYTGDVDNPRGGVRGVIPSKQDYPTSARSALECGASRRFVFPETQPSTTSEVEQRFTRGFDTDPLLPHLINHLSEAKESSLAVAFTLTRGVDLLLPHLQDLLDRGGRLRFLTGDYQGSTEPEALYKLLDLAGNVELRVFETAKDHPKTRPYADRAFHPKSYILTKQNGEGLAFVGSSNISESALRHGVEWNYSVTSSTDAPGFAKICAAFEELFKHPATVPLTSAWIDAYAKRRVLPQFNLEKVAEAVPEPLAPVSPHEIQREALAALEKTRRAGNKAGLVVLATGLGKTWLSAFDTQAFRRVLFVAHREEILSHAMKTFRRVRPTAHLGRYDGSTRDRNAEVLFASIQTLGRNRHLQGFARDEFDYIVVDEFHHACASTYRRLIDWFDPKFLLGLTATPERTDGGDLLALCGENLVYRCDLREGIRRDLLSPFHYFGVPDDVDYTNIPWRSTRFDEEALTSAVATKKRATNALEQLRARGGKRTLAFCVSQRHADFMADFFRKRGLRSVAVHAGPSSAPRALSLEQLEEGALDVVCAVDMFNEGVDLPDLDTVMMLRPTESRILWLQQLGRGLRKAEGKTHLNVIDYIGNHRTFLLKPQTLFDLDPGRQPMLHFLDRYLARDLDLPPGCEVTYDLEAIDILRKLVQPVRGETAALRAYYEEFLETNGVRPTATEAFHDGYTPRAARADHGSWMRFVKAMGSQVAEHQVAEHSDVRPFPAGLNSTQIAALDRHADFLTALETTEMSKSYKMVLLQAMLNADAFPGKIAIDALADAVTRVISRSAVLRADFGPAADDRRRMRTLLETNPINAWTGGRGTGGVAYFACDGETLRTSFSSDHATRSALQELTRELCDWRLAEYLARSQREDSKSGVFTCKVSHAGGRPILFLPDRASHPEIPEGSTPVVVDGETYQFDFVRVAVNVARRAAGGDNELPKTLRGWFGHDAGLPGTRHSVRFELRDGKWIAEPEGRQEGKLQLWRAYSREEIPPLFGMEFSTAIWNVGYVARSGHIFLLVTLDKAGHSQDFQYGDRFIDDTTFEWQSQNRTKRDGKDGQLIRNHAERGVPVHLFVRSAKKTKSGASAPFIYCGDVSFVSWKSDSPITVRWRLPEPLSERARNSMSLG